jgi:hypothetical protein
MSHCGEPILLADTRDITGISHFSLTVLKEFGNLLKELVWFCSVVIVLGLWPIAHNHILRYGPQLITKSCIRANSSAKQNPTLWPIVHNQILRYGP